MCYGEFIDREPIMNDLARADEVFEKNIPCAELVSEFRQSRSKIASSAKAGVPVTAGTIRSGCARHC